MKTYAYVFSFIVMLFGGCKKDKAQLDIRNMVTGQFVISGSYRWSIYLPGTSAQHGVDTINQLAVNAFIDQSSTLKVIDTLHNAHLNFEYNEGSCNSGVCRFVGEFPYGRDTAWFYKDVNPIIEIHSHSQDHFSNSAYLASGRKL